MLQSLFLLTPHVFKRLQELERGYTFFIVSPVYPALHRHCDFKEAPTLDVLLFMGHKSHPSTVPAAEYVL
jgi:hypothetical protein